jgi:O-methyltransferase involved in polyketide biosynthesis
MTNAQQPGKRDYSAISPSALSLVHLKGLTNIPFAKRTAELFSEIDGHSADARSNDLAFWKRVVHFEMRYLSVDQLLSTVEITNILELSSGYSWRGLDMVTRKNIHYIDTDLPAVINQKNQLLPALQEEDNRTIGNLETIPLNALDEEAFLEIVDRFPEGPIAIVNEGLMMYLNTSEKETLCRLIQKVLKQRGGVWITADVYVKSTLERFKEEDHDSLKELVEAQRIEDNMFESFAVAEKFFTTAGFKVDSEAVVEHSQVSSLPYLIQNATPEQLIEMKTAPKKIQATWQLSV